MKTPITRFNILNAPFLRRTGLCFVFLLGCAVALIWFAPPQSAFTFFTGGENSPPSQIEDTPAGKSGTDNPVSAPRQRQDGEKKSRDGVWSEIQLESLNGRISEGIPETARTLELNKKSLIEIFNSVPNDSAEKLADLSESDAILQLPLPEGGFMRFRIADSPVMTDDLLKKFPEIKSYRGQSIDDARVSVRADFSPRGFHATILTADKTISIHPARYDDTNRYVSYYGDDFKGAPFSCGVTDSGAPQSEFEDLIVREEEDAPGIATGATLRKYRFAIAVTQEYYNDPALGGKTEANTVASLNTWINSLNVIYERELAIRFSLVTNSDIIFKAEPDGLNNGVAADMLRDIQPILEAKVGLTNYDIGHVLGKDGDGGLGGLGVACAAGRGKGAGASGVSSPLGNAGSLKVFAHEIGHQFGAPHSWNGCNGPGPSFTAYEVGSGSTIMGYGGTCGSDNLVGSNDSRFHAISLKNINDYISRANQCAITEPTGNAAPVVDAGAGYTIPKDTPFALTATAADANNDVRTLTYTWEQFDNGGGGGGTRYSNPPYTDAGDQPGTTRPIFRAYAPTASPTRIFPSLNYILNNANDPPETVQDGNETRRVGEKLPQVARQMRFRVTARDNRSGAGGTGDDTLTLTVDGNAGPFDVTAPNTNVTWTGGGTQTVNWTVNNTNVAPINAANVKISLSTDGGNTFPTVLAASTANDGSESITVPNGIQTSAARVKIEAVGNIFFDISDVNFAINNGDTCPIVTGITPGAGNVNTNVTISGRNFTSPNVTAVKFGGSVNALFTIVNDTTITATVPAGASSGAITLSKPGCGDRQSASFTICAGAAQSLTIDDGSYNRSFPDKFHANRLTPTSYPATLTHVQIYFHNGDNNGQVGEQFTILAGANTDGDTNISNTAFQSVPAIVQTVGGFNTYALSTPITITSGDFVIGYNVPTGRQGAADSTAPHSRSYYSTDGIGFGLTTVDDYMIRGQYSTNCDPGATISPSSQSFNSAGGNGLITVTSQNTWTATSNAAWITINSGASGTVVYTVAPNGTGASRTGTITVAGQTFTVTQDVCVVGFAPAGTAMINATGGTFDIAVSAPAGCAWTAATNTPWITINSGASGTGDGVINYSVPKNPVTTTRTGAISIAGQALTVTQLACPGNPETLIYDDDDSSISGGGGYNVVRLTPASYPATLRTVQIYFNYTWGATGTPLTIVAGKNTDGDTNINNSIQQSFAANSGTARETYTTFTLPTPMTISKGDFVVGFKNGAGLTALDSIAPHRGRGYYSYDDGATFVNDTSPVDFKIRGQYTADCPSGSISPSARTVSGNGGSGTVNITATGAWTAFTDDAWITVDSGAGGTGNGTVNYTIARNSTGISRIGTIIIAGQTFTVTQDACGIAFTPANAAINTPGGTFSIAVSAPAGCAWTAATNTPWITINSGASGTGDGVINYSVPKNPVTTTRTGAISIAGQTLTVTQFACPGNPETLIYDDDVVNSGGSGGYNVVRLTPASYPATLKTVQVYFTDSWGTTGRNLTIVAGKNTDGDTNINGSIEQEIPANSGTTRNAYATFTLPTPMTISKGDFVVGFKVTEVSGFFPLAAETAAPNRGRSYYWNGATFVNVAGSDFKIRGQYTTDCPSGSISSPAPPTFGDGGGSGTVNVTSNGVWTAFSDDDWITITGSTNRADNRTTDYDGTGNGTVNYTVAPNTSGAPRVGSMSIAGNVFNVNQSLVPTAAAADVSGRILTSAGRGISNALVVFTAPDGSSRYARTNFFGYYRFEDVPTGQNYVITAQSKRYRFAARILTFNQAVDEFDIIAEP